jgi:enoyl-CoA hydratase/carnithine racemase
MAPYFNNTLVSHAHFDEFHNRQYVVRVNGMAGSAPIYRSRCSIAYAKEHLQRSSSLGFETALDLEAKAILTCMRSYDWREGLHAFGETRKPRFVGR